MHWQVWVCHRGSERIWKDFQLAWCICRSCDLHHPGFTSKSQGIDLHVSYYLFLDPLGCQVVIIAAFAPGLDVGFSDPQGWKSTSSVGQTPGAEWRERRLATLSTSSWQLQGDLEIFVDGFWRWSRCRVHWSMLNILIVKEAMISSENQGADGWTCWIRLK